MKNKKHKSKDLIMMENFLDYNKPIKKEEKTFEKLMFIYSIAIKELQTKMEILKEEFRIFYDYDLIDHINTRIKKPESIIKKMKEEKYDKRLAKGRRIISLLLAIMCILLVIALVTTFIVPEMIENINDIAGIRVVCPLKKDIFTIKDLIDKIPGIHILKEKDYVTKPKESGYSSYHLIVEVPITLSQNVIYVKVEIQIRTMAMDFWASLEHKMKYKPESEISKKEAKEWVHYAKILNKMDNKIMLLNE